MGVTMKNGSRQGVLMAMATSLLLFVGCSSESPTAPPSGGSGGGGNTPPTGASIAISVSNPNPVVSSTSVITATVTQNGQPVPNGTAVEFSTNFGTFTDTASTTTIRTTTNGVATATLTSSTAGAAVVTVRVNNVAQTTTITFQVGGGGGGNGAVAITSISPTTGRPSGGTLVTIRGSGFADPVRVLFGTKQATVVSRTDTEIQVVAPAIDLGPTEQARNVNITVITRAGSTSEASVTATTPFRYELEILTPAVFSVAPASGPNEGNTRITIFGEGFQAPVRVFFGTGGGPGNLTNQTELEVLQVSFGQIIAMTPPALGLGAPLRDQQVTVRVLNVATNKDAVLAAGFRYGPEMVITAVGPTEGPATGGTRVTIHGWGFDDPVAVVIGGVAAQPIRVSGTEIVAITSGVALESCADSPGPVSVTNIEDGASADGPEFIYRVLQPAIVNVQPDSAPIGGTIAVTVANPGGGAVRFTIGGKVVFPTGATVNPDGTVTYQVIIPPTLELDTEACPGGGDRRIPTSVDLTFVNVTTGCEDQLAGAVTATAQPAPVLFVTPTSVAVSATFASAAGPGAPGSGVFTIVNTGEAPMTITSITELNDACNAFTGAAFDPATQPPLGTCASTTYSVTFAPAAGQAACSATYQVVTNGGTANVTFSGTATAAQ